MCTPPPKILCIFYSEFHPIQGPKVTFCTPHHFPLHTVFEHISEYLIPKPELCGRLVTLQTHDYTVVGYPVMIENAKYDRNVMLFNLAFVFERGVNTRGMEQAVRKLARVLKNLEESDVESEFLYNLHSKADLQNIMDQLIDDLNNYKETHITVNDANEINIKLFPVYKNPPKVEDYHVPIALINLKSIMHGDWDMTMQRVLPYIDGVSYVKWISEQSSVDINLVKLCIQHLLYYGVVNIVDIFSFSNIYRATPGLRSLPLSDNLQLECLSYATKPGCTPPAAVDLLAWIGAFRVGVTVKQWIEGNSIPMDTIDVRRLVVFAVLKGWLKRVYSYPIYSASNGPIGNSNDGRQNTDTESWTSEAAGSEQRQSRGHSHTTKKTLHSSYPSQTQAAPKNQLRRYFNGTHHTDELCVLFGLTPKELEDYLSKDINIKIIMK